jgi:hypothetical protein
MASVLKMCHVLRATVLRAYVLYVLYVLYVPAC